MGLSYVGGVKFTNSTGLTTSVGYSPTPGNIIIAFLTTVGSIGSLTIKDQLNNALAAGPTVTNTNQLSSAWYVAPSGVTSFVATWTTSRTSSLVILEYAVTGGTMAVNTGLAGNTATGTGTAQSISLTTQDANDFVVAAFGGATLTFTANVGNSRQQVITAPRMLALDNTAASASAVTCSATSASTTWTGVAIELRFTPSVGVKNQAMLQGVGL